MIRFLHPEFLWGLLGLPAFWLLDIGWLAWRARRARQFADPGQHASLLPPHPAFRLAAKSALWSLAFAAMTAGLARPQLCSAPAVSRQPPGLQILLVLDTSLSMQAVDQKPSRWQAAADEIRSLLQRLPGDAFSLIACTSEAQTLSPLTRDQAALHLALNRAGVKTLPQPGSDYPAGVLLAWQQAAALPAAPSAVVVFTDGEINRSSGRLAEVMAAASGKNIPVYAVGVGTLGGGPIPLGRDAWGGERYRVFHGRRVITRLNPWDLQKLAALSRGQYFTLSGSGQTGRSLASALEAFRRRSARQWTRITVWELFPVLLGLSFGLLWLEPVIPWFGRRGR